MQLFLPFSSRNASSSLVLIEVQGELEGHSTSSQTPGSSDSFPSVLAGQSLGHLTLHSMTHESNSNTIATLVVGHHQFHGQLQKLPKPFAILQKKKRPSFMTKEETEFPMQKEATSSFPIWECQGIVKHRFLFNSRPKHIV
ncbi:hypothetical protein HMI54_012547 [Coelomomyces lativittatus]|nr:hypothetical protein HMI54_012547 [Coelomomyces lativittatus]KAJ1501378.1 hypothetical protein HMI56_003271 [Coelomomyces lativittatus]KAJ1518149.1 hypothetical protein HMI55_002398 [Coelomomyces lativittatus]